MNLRAFPFDAQVLNISFESGAHAADEVELQMLRTAGSNVAGRLVQEGGSPSGVLRRCGRWSG